MIDLRKDKFKNKTKTLFPNIVNQDLGESS